MVSKLERKKPPHQIANEIYRDLSNLKTLSSHSDSGEHALTQR